MLGSNPTQQEILVDHVVSGELSEQFQAVGAAIRTWRAAADERERMEVEHTAWMQSQAYRPFAEVEAERLARRVEIKATHEGAKRSPLVAVAAYNQARVDLLSVRFAKAGMAWCTEHRGVAPVSEMQLMYHQTLVWYSKSDDSYSVFPWNDGEKRYVTLMCAECRAKRGFGKRDSRFDDRSLTDNSHLFSAEKIDGRTYIDFPIGWEIVEFVDGEKLMRSAIGRELLPSGTPVRKFKIEDDWYDKTMDDWRIPPKLTWHINSFYPGHPWFQIDLPNPILVGTRCVEVINMLPYI